MIAINDLDDIRLLGTLADDMKAKLIPHITFQPFDHREIIFRGGDAGETFYMLKRGKILLEQRISSKITISVGAIKPGYSFGWSAVLGGVLTLDAVCAEPSEALGINGKIFKSILDDDPQMGYLVMQKLLRIIKRRLDVRTTQFLNIIAKHPDIKMLMDDDVA
jgi:CRP-like cAMP-binding protein